MSSKFIIRVYGILLKENAVLVSDEKVHGKAITKFPGGGMEFGEGTIECLQREFFEELNLKVDIIGHFYTTDFFVPSAFDENFQVISVYYLVKTEDTKKLQDLNSHGDKKQNFRWLELSEMKEHDFSLIIDKKVSRMIRERFLK